MGLGNVHCLRIHVSARVSTKPQIIEKSPRKKKAVLVVEYAERVMSSEKECVVKIFEVFFLCDGES